MQMGVTIGTIMVANVLMVIIPGQRKVVLALVLWTRQTSIWRARKAALLHNNYLLPVIFVMIGGHYPMVSPPIMLGLSGACLVNRGGDKAFLQHKAQRGCAALVDLGCCFFFGAGSSSTVVYWSATASC